jgi:hypothetical protein
MLATKGELTTQICERAPNRSAVFQDVEVVREKRGGTGRFGCRLRLHPELRSRDDSNKLSQDLSADTEPLTPRNMCSEGSPCRVASWCPQSQRMDQQFGVYEH